MMMPVIAKLLKFCTPPQLLNATGFFLFFVFSEILGRSSLATGQHQLFSPMILRRDFAVSAFSSPLPRWRCRTYMGRKLPREPG